MTDMAVSGVAQRDMPSTSEAAAYRHVLEADVILGAKAYETLRADWQRLAELQAGTVLFQSLALLNAWAHHFARGNGRPATVVVRRQDRVVLIWPLFIRRSGPFRVATGAGSPIGQYDEILIDPDCDGTAVVAEAIDALAGTVRPDLISLERVRADSALRAALPHVQPFCWDEGAPFTDLSDGMEGVWSSRKSRVTRQQRKRVRTFNERGEAEFAVASEAAEAKAWLTEALALKRGWLRQTGRLSRAFMKPATGECLVELAEKLIDADASPRMIVSRLALDGRTAAIEAGFCHNGAYYLYLGAFHADYARLGPGNVLTQKVMEWCVANGFERYDMLAPRSRNKREWQTNEVTIVDIALPLTLLGKVYAALVLKRLSPLMRDFFYALPPGARALVAGAALRL